MLCMCMMGISHPTYLLIGQQQHVEFKAYHLLQTAGFLPLHACKSNIFIHADVNREFNLSGAHPKMSKQAVLERRQQQQHDDDLTFRPTTNGPRGRSQSAGRQRPAGDQRLEQLARPKTAHWDKCKYVCPPTSVCHMTFSTWFCMWAMLSDICASTQTAQTSLAVSEWSDRCHLACFICPFEQCCADNDRGRSSAACRVLLFCSMSLYATLPVPKCTVM